MTMTLTVRMKETTMLYYSKPATICSHFLRPKDKVDLFSVYINVWTVMLNSNMMLMFFPLSV